MNFHQVALQAFKVVHAASERLQFDIDSGFDRYLIMLYLSILEKSQSLLVLVSNGQHAGIDTITRSIVEGWVDIVNLFADPAYIDVCNHEFYKRWVAALNSAEKGNPYLKGVSELNAESKAAIDYRQALKKLNDAGVKPLNAFERFSKADMVDEYHSIYNFTSSEAHNNLRHLISRHMELGEDGQVRLVVYRPLEPEEFDASLDILAGILVDTALKILGRYGMPDDLGKVEALRDLRNEFRADLLANPADLDGTPA